MLRIRVHLLVLGLAGVAAANAPAQRPAAWPQHSLERPQPPVVDPGPFKGSAAPPSDAVVLFDGRKLEKWQSADGSGRPAKWKVASGYVEVVPGAGAIATIRPFGDVQLHAEWATPDPGRGEGQERGNSGIFFMGKYELQILDSYRNATYPDGQAGAIYGEFPPLVNATRPPGEWQSYDVLFHGPRFDAEGKLSRPARMTVLHNGVLVQDDVELLGPTANKQRLPYAPHPDRLPLTIQDHGALIRFRNVWIRELPDAAR
jgi:3-keto-disaccharide hydrolase